MQDVITNIPQQGTILVIPPTSTVIMPPTASMLPNTGFQTTSNSSPIQATSFKQPKKNYNWLFFVLIGGALIYLFNKK